MVPTGVLIMVLFLDYSFEGRVQDELRRAIMKVYVWESSQRYLDFPGVTRALNRGWKRRGWMRELLKTETVILGCGMREIRRSKKVLMKSDGTFTRKKVNQRRGRLRTGC